MNEQKLKVACFIKENTNTAQIKTSKSKSNERVGRSMNTKLHSRRKSIG